MANSKTDEVYILLKQMIIDRELKPGVQLKEVEFSKTFGVSRSTLRKALTQLKNDGFVESFQNKGSYVIDPSLEDICAAYKFRSKLEKLLYEEIIDKVKPKDIKALEEYIVNQECAYKMNDVIAYIESNKKFHLTIAKLSDNKYLINTLKEILNTLDILLILYDNYHEKGLWDNDMIVEHKLIVKNLKEKNLYQLKNIMNKHIQSSCDKLKQMKIK